MSKLLELFLAFAKIGLFTIGGGYAMIAIIEELCVEKKKWMSHQEMMELIVIAESTPGPIAINCATYAGYRRGGFPGAAAATVGMVLPSFLIIYFISLFLDNFLDIPLIASAFRGIKVGVGVVILQAGWNMLKKIPRKRLPRILLAAGFAAMLLPLFLRVKISALALMVTAGLISLAVSLAGGEEK